MNKKRSDVTYKSFRFEGVLAKDRVLLFSDDVITTRVLGKVLKRRGFILTRIKEPANPAQQLWEANPGLIILDFDHSSIDSIKLCRELKRDRRVGRIPVVILSGHHTRSKDIIRALEAGAEDYIFKPLDVRLFLARIRVIFRKRIFQQEPEETLESGNIMLNLTTHRVSVDDKSVRLRPKEFALLYFLMRRKGQVLSRRTLLRNVWEHRYFGTMRTVNSHIQTLRKKLGDAGTRIESVKGIGYRLRDR